MIKMKKKTILLAILLLAVFMMPSAAIRSSAANEVTVYLVLGRGAKLNGSSGANNSELFLENSVEYTAALNAPLPTAVTREGYVFEGWMHTVDAQIKMETTLIEDGAILYARWTFMPENNPRLSDPVEEEEDLAKADFYISPDETLPKQYRMNGMFKGEYNTTEYSFVGHFEEGFAFMFRSAEPPEGIKGTVFPNLEAGKGDTGYTLCNSGTSSNKTTDYIGIMNTAGTAEVTPTFDSSKNWSWYSFGNKDAGALFFKVSGTFAVYARVFDKGGWVEVYVEPA